MRKLNVQDLFNFTKVMKAADLKKELQPLIVKGKNSTESSEDEVKLSEDAIKQIGLEAILTVIEACGNAGVEKGLYKFLSGPFEMEEKEIATMSIESLFERLQQLAKENNLSRFFKNAANLMK